MTTRHTVYCLHSTRTRKGRTCDRSYIGYTVDMKRRLRQHNGEIKGGAKATHWCVNWRVVWTVRGFATANHALQLEWRLHHPRGRRRGRGFSSGGDSISRRTRDLYIIMQLERFTSKAPRTVEPSSEYVLQWSNNNDAEIYAHMWPAYVKSVIIPPAILPNIVNVESNSTENEVQAAPASAPLIS